MYQPSSCVSVPFCCWTVFRTLMLNRKDFNFCVFFFLWACPQHKEVPDHPGWCSRAPACVEAKRSSFSLYSAPYLHLHLKSTSDKSAVACGNEKELGSNWGQRPVLFQRGFGGLRAGTPQHVNLHILGDRPFLTRAFTATQKDRLNAHLIYNWGHVNSERLSDWPKIARY